MRVCIVSPWRGHDWFFEASYTRNWEGTGPHFFLCLGAWRHWGYCKGQWWRWPK